MRLRSTEATVCCCYNKSGTQSPREEFLALLSIQGAASLHRDAAGYGVLHPPCVHPCGNTLPCRNHGCHSETVCGLCRSTFCKLLLKHSHFFRFICPVIIFIQCCSSEEVKSQLTRDIQFGASAPSTSKIEGNPQTKRKEI